MGTSYPYTDRKMLLDEMDIFILGTKKPGKDITVSNIYYSLFPFYR